MTQTSSHDQKGDASPINPRTQARLAAVQALYQIKMSNNANAELIVEEFQSHRLGDEVDGMELHGADRAFFADIVKGVCADREEIDELIKSALAAGWSLDRLENIMLAILRAGIYELRTRVDVPSAVVINEYVDVAHAFFDGSEPGFVNGILDRLSKSIRS